MKIFIKIVIGIIILALVGFGIWFVLDNTDGGTGSFKTFTVSLNGEEIESQEYDFYVERGESYTFDMKYTLNIGENKSKGFNVKVVPNYDAGITDFSVGDRVYSLYGEKDLTKCFDIEMNENSFTLSIPEDFSLKTVLDELYKGKTVNLNPIYLEESKPFYTILISSHDESYAYEINFGVNVHVKGITIQPEEIVLG
ncbi:MAG: hypothetical protein IKT32_00390 [Clostridia bacterium]|nr:hypothetical protein [Clostridia bacterium]